jgi:UDP:flavonoid glycosyltransferase YjiC (YdhE family)
VLEDYLARSERPVDRESKLRWHAGYAPALFADATAELESRRYDAVMVDPLEPGADFAAEAVAVPSFSYVHWRMDELGADVPFCFHLWDRETPAEDAFVGWWNELRARVGLPAEPRPVSEHRWYRHSRALTLILGLPELVHPKGELPPYAARVGPLLWEPSSQERVPEWVERLGTSRPALLGSLSTVGRADAELVNVIACSVAGEDLDVVLTVPAEGDLPRLPPNVRLAGFIPHSVLVDRTSLVLCQAGNGTVTRAACAGVPLLLFPDGRDRFEVARGAVAAGTAIAFERDGLDAEKVREAIRALLTDSKYRARSKKLAVAARKYRAATTSADRIEALISLA